LSLSKIILLVQTHSKFLVTSHIDPDGDSIGSQLALASLLAELGKEVIIVNEDNVPRRYRFLPQSERIRSLDEPDSFSFQGRENFKVAFVLDSADLSRIGSVQNLLSSNNMILVNIDHHQSNSLFGSYVYVDPEASSTAELLHRLIKELKIKVGEERAISLYTAIMTDTMGFRTPSTSSQVFEICSALIREGANPTKIAEAVYFQKTPESVKLLGEVLTTLELYDQGRIGSLSLTQEVCQRLKVDLEESEGFVNQAISINGVKVGLFFRELSHSKVRVSLRSRDGVDVNQIAQLFKGGGHPQAAGCTIEGNLEEVKSRVVEEIKKKLALEEGNF